jgi:hypothetical protein
MYSKQAYVVEAVVDGHTLYTSYNMSLTRAAEDAKLYGSVGPAKTAVTKVSKEHYRLVDGDAYFAQATDPRGTIPNSVTVVPVTVTVTKIK